MALMKIAVRLSEDALAWLPVVAQEHLSGKGKPEPMTPREWMLEQVKRIVTTYAGPLNRMKARGFLLLRTGGQDAQGTTRLEAKDLHAETFRWGTGTPTEGANAYLEIPEPFVTRLQETLALLHLYQEKEITHDEPFETVEGWLDGYLPDLIADAYTAYQNRLVLADDLSAHEDPAS